MPTPAHVQGKFKTRIGDSALATRLKSEIKGDVLFDAFSRGRYSTDASIYQIEPIGVAVPKSTEDMTRIIQIAADEGIPVLPRGGGTSQCGQTVGEALVIDGSKHLNRIHDLNVEERTVWAEPGLVLDHLNAALKPHGLWFPVDVSTSSRATLGGMTGNNSCGARSIRYGTMRDNVRAIDGLLADGSAMHFGEVTSNQGIASLSAQQKELVDKLLDIGRIRENDIRSGFPDLMRRVGGYNVDALIPDGAPKGAWAKATVGNRSAHPNLAHLLVGSEGTLAVSSRIQLDLQPLPKHKTLGVCHFPTFHDAMASTRHIVKLGPAAVELVDRTMINLARDIPVFRSTVDQFVDGEPDALLLVEFAGDEREDQIRDLKRLVELMADLGFPGAVVEAVDPDFQKAIWEVRKSGLNIMMSMKGDGKPISFIEDCAVRLEDLAEFTGRLTDVFHKHNTEGTWYAHASVGCLHVRPVINLKGDLGASQMRAIAEEAFSMVREYKGSHSGEHGDGLVRSEFHETMFGKTMVDTFKDVKQAFDPNVLMNPGKIVDPPKMDDRNLFRFKPGYKTDTRETAYDWSAWGGFGGAVEMCNNNGACRKRDAGVMCPSFRATSDERHLTRGRANSLRMAVSGQLGNDALTSDDMYETMKLCVSCKGCKRECPTGIDMAKMKTEFLYHYRKRHGLRLFDRLVAYLPRYAPMASRFGWLLNLRNTLPGSAKLGELISGVSAKRDLPRWSIKPFSTSENDDATSPDEAPQVILWADSFNTYFEPENTRAALRVLKAGGYRVHLAKPKDGGRPLCCGRTFLAAGLVDEARAEITRLVDSLAPLIEQGIPLIGLEPSCLFTLRDELQGLFPGDVSDRLARQSFLLEEFLAAESEAGRLKINLKSLDTDKVLLHGHCHQKAFDVMGAVETTLNLIPDLEVETIESSCCGMAGSFGYEADNQDVSMTMGELSLFPAVRGALEKTPIVADGTSCRHQIADGTGRSAEHVARLLDRALAEGSAR
jgi:FAD/FMN-containing dehydrogenase/Fe-S oxidoreductase